jgi:hypothetical protein
MRDKVSLKSVMKAPLDMFSYGCGLLQKLCEVPALFRLPTSDS